jgi:hypothetical protein
MKKPASFAAFVSLLAWAAAPVSARTMRCSGPNMAKLDTMISSMQDGPKKSAMGEEMVLARAEMEKGQVLRACLHMRKAQKLGTKNLGMI